MDLLHIVSISCLLLTITSALPDGPPTGACKTMQPGTRPGEIGLEGHTDYPQNVYPSYGNTKKPPYYVMISPNAMQYSPNQFYSVFIVANQTGTHNYYKGIILQARKVICASNDTMEVEEEPYGIFSVSSGDHTTLLKTMDCTHERSTVCHRSPQYKVNETATWQSPSEYVGHLVLWGTVVQSANIYWTELHSHILQDPTAPPAPVCAAPTIYSSTLLLMVGCMLVKHLVS